MSLTSVLLPLPLTPVTQMNVAAGKATSMPLRLFSVAPRTTSCLPLPRRRSSGTGTDRCPLRYCAVMLSGVRTDVDDVVGGADGVLVVLHHDERVADVAQPLEGADELVVVALVEPDRWLVEDVEHAHEAAADLRGQADALRLAAAERGRAAIEGEVVEADVMQEAEPLADLLEDLPSDERLALTELEPLDATQGGDDAVAAQVHDVHAVDGHCQVLRLEAAAIARRARLLHHQPLDLLLDPVGLGLAVAALEVVDDALESGVVAS